MSLNEADTCRVYVTPGLRDVGWETLPYSIAEQYTFTDGRVEFAGNKTKRGVANRNGQITCFVIPGICQWLASGRRTVAVSEK
jgi:type I site-specific restriction endonuclease